MANSYAFGRLTGRWGSGGHVPCRRIYKLSRKLPPILGDALRRHGKKNTKHQKVKKITKREGGGERGWQLRNGDRGGKKRAPKKCKFKKKVFIAKQPGERKIAGIGEDSTQTGGHKFATGGKRGGIVSDYVPKKRVEF